MSSLIDIQSQIEKLQKQATEIKAKEFDSTVQDILSKMHAYGITIKDLQNPKSLRSGRGSGRAKKMNVAQSAVKFGKKAGGVVAPKYRGPNGETWSGRGLTPKWLSTLIAQGQPKESFAINAQ